MMIILKFVTGYFKMQCDWLTSLSDYRMLDYKLPDYKPSDYMIGSH